MTQNTSPLSMTSSLKVVSSAVENNSDYLSPDIKLLKKLNELIEQNFRSVHDHEFYAKTLYLSLTRINGLTRFYLNKTVYELIQERIHEEAKALLRYTAMSSKQISYELGICDPSYFGRCFRKREGISPNAYRRSTR